MIAKSGFSRSVTFCTDLDSAILYETILTAVGGSPEVQIKDKDKTALLVEVIFEKVEPRSAALLECKVSGRGQTSRGGSRVTLKLSVSDDTDMTVLLCSAAIHKLVESLLRAVESRPSKTS
jgi:hypothetical protein